MKLIKSGKNLENSVKGRVPVSRTKKGTMLQSPGKEIKHPVPMSPFDSSSAVIHLKASLSMFYDRGPNQ